MYSLFAGEVMYGNIRQLVVVSKNWKDLKAMHQRDEPLPRPYREEGIILRQYQVCVLTGYKPIIANEIQKF